MSNVVRIEQRLQDVPQFFFVPADEAIFLGIPLVIGFISRNIGVGIVLGFLLFIIWKRVKRGGGVPHVMALAYWLLPREITAFRSLPDSGVTVWRA